MLRIKLAIAAGTLILLFFGIIGAWEGIKWTRLQVLTYDQFLKERPQDGYYRITGAMLSIPEGAQEVEKEKYGDKEKATRCFIPLRRIYKPGSNPDKTLFVVVETQDAGVMSAYDSLPSGGGGNAQLSQLYQNSQATYFPQREVEGMIKAGVNADSETRAKVASLSDNLAPDYVVIKEGTHPAFLKSVMMIIAALGLGAAQIWWYRFGED